MRASYFIFILLLISCKTENKPEIKKLKFPLAGEWLMEFDLGEATLPVNFSVVPAGEESFTFTFKNAGEKILVSDILHFGDSVCIQMPVFSSKFYLKTVSKKKMSGYFISLSRSKPYKVPVVCHYGPTHRFRDDTPTNSGELQKNWQVTFAPNKPEEMWTAGGVFNRKNNGKVTGTFLTETGDYRYLDGDFYNDTLMLSSFDGAHLFMFSAIKKGDSLVGGQFYSGRHYTDTWIAKASEDFDLRDPSTITKVSGNENWRDIVVKNLMNEDITLGTISKDDKVRIVQIFGSWCPNCMDETNYYKELKTIHQDNIQIIPVGFEKKGEGIEALTRFKLDMQLPYDIYLGGVNKKKTALEVFPMLNKVISFPTSIFIDKKGVIRKIHTGFYGPGTGSYYRDYMLEMNAFIKELIAE